MLLLGMAKAFTNAANFSGMTINTKLKLSDIVHKAFIEVKNGLEAAGGPATAAAQEGFNSNYSLWTQRTKVNFLLPTA